MMNDNEIVDMYWERNESAIRETDRKYGRYCTIIAMNILCKTEDAEEICNDTWLAAWNSIPPNRPEVLKTYLGKITRRRNSGCCAGKTGGVRDVRRPRGGQL